MRQPPRLALPGLLPPLRRRHLPPHPRRPLRRQDRARHRPHPPPRLRHPHPASFGPVHNRPTTPGGDIRPCRCRKLHEPTDARIGTPLNPATYDYEGAVLFNAHASALWARFTTYLRREIAAGLGMTQKGPRGPAGVLREGRRVPAARPGPLPRRHPTRRPRRQQPAPAAVRHRRRTHQGRPRRRRAGPRHGRPRMRSGNANSAGANSSTCARSPPSARRRIHRPGRGRLRGQVRHQIRRRLRHPRPHPPLPPLPGTRRHPPAPRTPLPCTACDGTGQARPLPGRRRTATSGR